MTLNIFETQKSCNVFFVEGMYECLPWPRIYSRHLESVVPRSRISPLSFRPGTDPMTMCFPFLPTTTISTPIIEVEPSPIDLGLVDGGRARSPRGGNRPPDIPPRHCSLGSLVAYSRLRESSASALFPKFINTPLERISAVGHVPEMCHHQESTAHSPSSSKAILSTWCTRSAPSCVLIIKYQLAISIGRAVVGAELSCPGRSVWTPASWRTRVVTTRSWNRPSSTERPCVPFSDAHS